jgi:hypothetical protein
MELMKSFLVERSLWHDPIGITKKGFDFQISQITNENIVRVLKETGWLSFHGNINPKKRITHPEALMDLFGQIKVWNTFGQVDYVKEKVHGLGGLEAEACVRAVIWLTILFEDMGHFCKLNKENDIYYLKTQTYIDAEAICKDFSVFIESGAVLQEGS